MTKTQNPTTPERHGHWGVPGYDPDLDQFRTPPPAPRPFDAEAYDMALDEIAMGNPLSSIDPTIASAARRWARTNGLKLTKKAAAAR